MAMRFSVLTLFPELVESIVQTSITGRAIKNGRIELSSIQIRDFAVNAYGQVDDTLYGGGTGMLLRPEPVYAAWLEATGQSSSAEVVQYPEKTRTIFLSPKGRVLNQDLVEELATCPHLILVCGHYEGIDQRVLDAVVDEEVSIGDYVLSGGELAAMVVLDCIVRQLPGALGDAASAAQDSFVNGLLDCPHYTRPEVFKVEAVPPVLLSGNHAHIDRWRLKQALGRTWTRRPDLLAARPLT